jgi:hypothetical protein
MWINRRELLSGLAVGCASAALPGFCSPQASASELRINVERLRGTLEGLTVYGRPRGGTFADGVSRVAVSDADLVGRKDAMQLMGSFGIEPRIDPAGKYFRFVRWLEPRLEAHSVWLAY